VLTPRLDGLTEQRLAGVLGETISVHLAFYIGAAAVVGSVVLLAAGRGLLSHVDDEEPAPQPELAQAVTVGDG
jgi:hypothetical protein